jgi:hypothetical protein
MKEVPEQGQIILQPVKTEPGSHYGVLGKREAGPKESSAAQGCPGLDRAAEMQVPAGDIFCRYEIFNIFFPGILVF